MYGYSIVLMPSFPSCDGVVVIDSTGVVGLDVGHGSRGGGGGIYNTPVGEGASCSPGGVTSRGKDPSGGGSEEDEDDKEDFLL